MKIGQRDVINGDMSDFVGFYPDFEAEVLKIRQKRPILTTSSEKSDDAITTVDFFDRNRKFL